MCVCVCVFDKFSATIETFSSKIHSFDKLLAAIKDSVEQDQCRKQEPNRVT